MNRLSFIGSAIATQAAAALHLPTAKSIPGFSLLNAMPCVTFLKAPRMLASTMAAYDVWAYCGTEKQLLGKLFVKAVGEVYPGLHAVRAAYVGSEVSEEIFRARPKLKVYSNFEDRYKAFLMIVTTTDTHEVGAYTFPYRTFWVRADGNVS